MWQIKNQMQFELLHLAMKRVKSAIMGQIAIIAIVAHQFYDFVPKTYLFIWVGLHIVLFVVRIYTSERFLKMPDSEVNYEKATRFLHMYTFLLFVTGIGWAFVMIFLVYVPPVYYYFFYAVIVGLTFGSILSVGPILPMFFVFTVPMNIALAYHIVTRVIDDYYYDVFAAMIVVFAYALRASKEYRKLHVLLIQERLKVEENLKKVSVMYQKKSVYLEAIDKIGIAMVVKDKTGKIVEENESAKKYFGDMVAKSYETLKDQCKEVERKVGSIECVHLKSKKRYEVFTKELPAGNKEWYEVLFFSDITQEYKHQKALEKIAQRYYQKARIDPLTKVFNREAFFDAFEKAIYESNREFSKIALLFLDVDSFKEINDTYGHKVGDLVLQIIAKRITSSIKHTDIVGRYAGDEFVIVLKSIEKKEIAEAIAHKLLDVLEKPIVLGKNKELHVTVSIGMTFYPDDAEDMDTLVNLADQAMYSIKRQAKNGYAVCKKGGVDAESV